MSATRSMLSSAQLSSGIEVKCLHVADAHFADGEMSGYFKNGIDVRPGDTVFDVGANIGIFSLHALRRGEGNVQIHAIEPIPPVFQALSENIGDVDSGDIKLYNFALAETEGEAPFSFFPSATLWNSCGKTGEGFPAEKKRMKAVFHQGIKEGLIWPELRFLPTFVRRIAVRFILNRKFKFQNFNCRLRRLSDVVQESGVERIDLLKIDVEGSELSVLNGIDDDDWNKIKKIVIEVEQFQTRSQTILQMLEKHGFDQIVLEQSAVEQAGNMGMMYARRTDT